MNPFNTLWNGHISELSQLSGDHCVSLLLPLELEPHAALRNTVLFRQMIDRAAELLERRGLRRSEAEELLEPATNRLHDEEFWPRQSNGLAMYMAPGFSREIQLPAPVREQVMVAPEFQIRVLLPFVQSLGEFYILVLTQSTAMLLRADRNRIEEIHEEGLPENLREALSSWRERRINPQTTAARPESPSGEVAPVHQGTRRELDTAQIEPVLQSIDRSLAAYLRNSESPLVFAGERELFDVYNRLTTCENFLREPVDGGLGRYSMEELHDRAWALAEPVVSAPLQFGMEDYLAARSQQRGTEDTDLVLTAAVRGMVDLLLLPTDRVLTGALEESNGAVTLVESHAGSERDIGNFAAIHVVRNRGSARMADFDQLPETSNMAAILRAPVTAIDAQAALA